MVRVQEDLGSNLQHPHENQGWCVSTVEMIPYRGFFYAYARNQIVYGPLRAPLGILEVWLPLVTMVSRP